MEVGNVLHHVKIKGELSGMGECPGNMSGGNISRGNVRILRV